MNVAVAGGGAASMPAADTLLHFREQLRAEKVWSLPGWHYQKTAARWLKKLAGSAALANKALTPIYGKQETQRQVQRWRMFFMACEEPFGYRGGHERAVCHYRFSRQLPPIDRSSA